MRLFKMTAWADLVGAALVVAVGVFLVVRSPQYGLHREGVMGPGFFPFWSGVALIIFGVATVIGALLRARRSLAPDAARGRDVPESDDRAEQDASEPAENGSKVWRLTVVFGLTIVATALVPFAGIYVAFGVLILVLVVAVEREHWASSIAVAAGSIVVLYLIFSVLLRIPVPVGPWGF